MDRMKGYRLVLFLLAGFLAYGALCCRAKAMGFYENPYIVMSPDGQAWTVPEKLPFPADRTDLNAQACWYPSGEEFVTGIESSLLLPGEGEHYYRYDRKGLVPIKKWRVVHRAGRCIHKDVAFFHGNYYNVGICRKNYYSGWNAWCADCGELLDPSLIYMSREKIHLMEEIDVSLDYYYDCPNCGHLEQGIPISHKCKEISANRYQVVYRANAGDAAGYMHPGFYMYNNAEVFEGLPVTPVKTLSINVYTRTGYRFIGWNTDPQGNGDYFEDGQEIFNLTAENYDPENGKGIVTLYAQWEKVYGTLTVDPGKGRFQGKLGISELTVKYGEELLISSGDVEPPTGALVRFETFGGNVIPPIRGGCRFLSWKLEQPSRGILQGELYQYLGENGGRDKVSALYQEEGIKLPFPVRQGFSFGGWYKDPECVIPAGDAGELFVSEEDVTLYACWVELVLDAKLNLEDHAGRGAVDLQWFQPDGNRKVYHLYQKREGNVYHKIYDATGEAEDPELVNYDYSGGDEIYKVSRSGFYELETFGAQGQSYESFEGGKGGSAAGKFYLKEGDSLTIRIGGQQKYGDGGDGQGYGNGGGKTEIVSQKLGTLLVAGGGGGASPGGNGGVGGLENGLWNGGNGKGQDGSGGGGGGFLGGLAGEQQIHVHDGSCLHQHLGDEWNGGECYTRSETEKNCDIRVVGPLRTWETENCMHCLASGRNGYNSLRLYSWTLYHESCGQQPDYGTNGWWVCETCGYRGYSYGSGSSRPQVSGHKYVGTVYLLICDREYDCAGKTLDRFFPSYGGSSYIKKEAACSYEQRAGVREGNGFALIRPVNTGFLEETELSGVSAPDLRPPAKIVEKTIRKQAEGNGRIAIQFSAPQDEGTVYYHQVMSYPIGSEKMLSASNVTCTEVITGVVGYYYRMDDREECVLTEINADNRENLLRDPFLVVQPQEKTCFLHIAAVDRAGNVGECVTVRISEDDPEIEWKLSTGQMEAGGSWEGTDYGSVLPVDEKTYYVKADGNTPFLLKFGGVMDGKPRADYQIDRAAFTFSIMDDNAEGQYAVLLPSGNFEEEETTSAGQWGRITKGKDLLEASMYGKGLRTERGRKLEICQSFTLDRKYHGRSLILTPSIGAAHGKHIVFSDEEEDKGHGVILIGDGEPPEIHGLDFMDQNLIDREKDGELIMDLWAEDDLSGVSSFSATLFNLDNYGEHTYYPGEDGHIHIVLSDDSPMFSGDLNLTVRAKDGVGNETVLEKGATEFGLRAEIVKILPPHTPEFKRGESGVLKVTAWGYADRLEISFPDEFVSEDPSLNCVFTYEVPIDKQEEVILFMVPLYLQDSREYSVTVRAYKGDRLLEQHPVLCTLSVNDTVLNELRTRLR